MGIILRAIYDWSRKTLIEKERSRRGSQRCPNCRMWTCDPQCPPPRWCSAPDDPDSYSMTCMNCGWVSRWVDTGFMGLLVAEENIAVADQRLAEAEKDRTYGKLHDDRREDQAERRSSS